jgi:hypothetical protein
MVWGISCRISNCDRVMIIPGKAKLDSAIYGRTVKETYFVPMWNRCCDECDSASKVMEDC